MIYKVFYQETKDRNPRRENTKTLYIDIEAKDELEGRIKARKLVEEKQATTLNILSSSQTNTSSMKKKQAFLK